MMKELLELLREDVYTDAPEYSEQVARIFSLLEPTKQSYGKMKSALTDELAALYEWRKRLALSKQDNGDMLDEFENAITKIEAALAQPKD